MTGLTADAEIAVDYDLLGKVASDLQSDIQIEDDEITGTLNYLDDYTGHSEDETEQVGNFLALRFSNTDFPGATITAELGEDEVELDKNGIAIFRITDKSTQTIKVVASMSGYVSQEKTYDLSGLTLEAAPAQTPDTPGGDTPGD